MNRVVLTGRITRDPEIRYSQTGQSNLRFTVAVDRPQSRDANGNRQADFISCVAFGQQAEFMSRFIKKGYMLAIEGRIQTGQYQGQDGQVHYTTDVVVDRLENLQPRDMSQPQQAQYQQSNPYQGYNNPSYGSQPSQSFNRPQQSQEQEPVEAPQSFNVDVADDDLPF